MGKRILISLVTVGLVLGLPAMARAALIRSTDESLSKIPSHLYPTTGDNFTKPELSVEVGSVPESIDEPDALLLLGIGDESLLKIPSHLAPSSIDESLKIPSHFFPAIESNFAIAQSSIQAESVTESIPEPGALLLLSSGLAALAGYRQLRLRRKKK